MEEPAALTHAATAQEVVANLGGRGIAGVVHIPAIIPHAAAALKVGAQLHASAFDGSRSRIVGAPAIRRRACISRAAAAASGGVLVGVSSSTAAAAAAVLVVASVTASRRSSIRAWCSAVASSAATIS